MMVVTDQSLQRRARRDCPPARVSEARLSACVRNLRHDVF